MNPRTEPRATAAGLRARAEAALRSKAGTGTENPPSLTPGSALAMLHELQVHQIELEMQNEELRAAQLELEESRARYLDLYNLAPVGQCTIDHSGLILQANLTLATLLGVMRGVLVGQSFARFIIREDQDTFHLLTRQILAAQATVKDPASPCHSCELRLKQGAGGTAVWVSLVVTAARGQNGGPEMRVVVTDISPRRAREAADRLEAQTQMEILNTIPAHVALVDPEGVIQVTNESWRRFATANRLQGPEFSLGQNYLKVCERATGPCSEEAKDAAAGIRQVLRGEVDEFSIEYPCHSPTEQRWFRLMATPLREGRGGGAVVMHVNITERKLAEVNLRNSEARARAIIEASPVAMALNDSAGRITFLNPAFTAAFGYALADIPTLADWWPKAYPDPAYRQQVAERWQAELRRAAQPGTAFAPLELSIRCKDGTERFVMVSAAPLGETFAGTHLVVLHDITERWNAEAALRESRERFLQLADTIEGVFWISDVAKNHFVYISPAYEKIWGRTCEQLYQHPRSWMEAIHPEDRPRIVHAAETKQALGLYDETYRILRPDGEMRWVHDKAFPVTDPTGEVRRIVGTAEDITARVEMEDQVRQSQKLQTIGTLAAGIAHDFNNILAAILGNTELAMADIAPEHPARESLDGIQKASARAKGLVQQILAFSSQQPMERHSLALGPVVLEVAKLLRATIPAGVQIDTSVDPDAPPVLADATQMHQILANLCTNSWHALGDGPGCIEVNLRSVTLTADTASRIAGLRPGRYACLSVRDNGKGMDAATLKRIFDPFFTTKGPGKGTGLGLSVVHGIVRGYQGAIQVVSQPGEGTLFTLYFPASVPAPTDAAPSVTTASSIRDTNSHILYLDDDESLLCTATRMLERLGYRVTGFIRPADAVKAFRDNPGQFDLAVTDMNMPEVTGLAVAKDLLKVRADLPIVLVSGNIEEELRHAARAAGIRGIVCKPFTNEEICEAIRLHASNQRQP